jgi:hypothetical protein
LVCETIISTTNSVDFLQIINFIFKILIRIKVKRQSEQILQSQRHIMLGNAYRMHRNKQDAMGISSERNSTLRSIIAEYYVLPVYSPSIKCRKFRLPARHFLLLKPILNNRKRCAGCLNLHFILGGVYKNNVL